MRLGILVVLGAILPLEAAVVYTIDPTISTPINGGAYAGSLTLHITTTGKINLNGPTGLIETNPDGSMASSPLASCAVCWSPGYQYFISGSSTYPTFAGGDGINHFAGGGGNYDLFPADHSAWAAIGKQTTNTNDPGALRFGALAYTFNVNPTATDWSLLGYGGTFVTPAGGGTLLMQVADTFYPNNTGSYTVTIDTQLGPQEIPEPAAIWLAFSGFAVLGVPRAFRWLPRKR